MNLSRSSGILLHVTSLPGAYGVGDLGPEAYRFVDLLAQTDQRIWQVLPLVPVGYGYSPYASPSTFAGNPLFISPERLKDQGLLTADDLADTPDFPAEYVDFESAIDFKRAMLERAYERFEDGQGTVDKDAFDRFCFENRDWLDDYALFMALKEKHGGVAWTDWDERYVKRRPDALDQARGELARGIHMRRFWQFLFTEQWDALRAYCHERDIQILGDLPIYVAEDSADVWANPELFHLREDGRPTVVAGVPPDYFSETGQRWGNPLYRWDVMDENGYDWWTRRFRNTLKQVDIVRLDHFRGFEAYWEIPATEETAVKGEWVKGPGSALFHTLQENLGEPLPVVAENLGVITQGVVDLMEEFNFPGMAILQFAFDGDATDDFLPHNYERNLVAYTGTHDNDTVVGWWTNNASTQDAEHAARARCFAQHYLDIEEDGSNLHWAFVRGLMRSVADVAIMPLQDLLGLGSDARMNTPGKGTGNWAWRYSAEQFTDDVAARLKLYTEIYGRSENKKPTL